LLQALTLAGFNLLLAGELCHAQGRCSLGCQGVQKAAILGRIILLTQAVAEVEHSDQLPLVYQWDCNFYSRLFKSL